MNIHQTTYLLSLCMRYMYSVVHDRVLVEITNFTSLLLSVHNRNMNFIFNPPTIAAL